MIQQEAPSTIEQKDQAIEVAIKELDKEFGANTLVHMGRRATKLMPSVPTGLFNVDYDVIGCGGFPKGRIIEQFGIEGGGKTSIALRAVAESQQSGGRAAFVDVEQALNPNWAGRLGVNMDELLVSQPNSGEEALRIVDRLIESMAFDVIVVDSVAALVPTAELEGDIGDSHVGLQARMMSQALRILSGKVRKSNCALLFINQLREKIGISYGDPNVTPGGRALKFYASLRLNVSRGPLIKVGESVIGNKVRIKCVKNKVDSPFRETEVDLIYEQGFDRTGSLMDAAVAVGVVDKAGAWYSYKGERIGQGREKAIATLDAMNAYGDILSQVLAKRNNE
jgi:recombination protein RecA